MKSLFASRPIDKNSTSVMVLFLSFSNVISNALTIVSGLLVAKWMLPEELGHFNVFTIVSGYLVLIQLGIPSALSRELPFHIGKGNKTEAEKYASVAQFWQKAIGLGLLLIGALAALIFFLMGHYEVAMGTLTVGVTTWQILYVTKYLKVLYRTNQDFNKLSWIKLATAFFVFASIYLVWLFGFYGLCLRAILSAMVDFVFTYRWRPLRVNAVWSPDYFKSLMRTGLPMFTVASVYGLWPLVQRTVIVSLGGQKSLGLFAIAFMAENAMVTVSSAVNNVVYPRMSMLWGKGATVGELIKVVSRPIFMSVVLLLFALPIGWWLLPIFVEYFIPNYKDGIVAAQWMLVVGFIEPVTAFSNIYNVTKNQLDRLIVYLSGVGVWAALVFILYAINGFSLTIFPASMVAAFIVMSVINFYHIRKVWNKKSTDYD